MNPISSSFIPVAPMPIILLLPSTSDKIGNPAVAPYDIGSPALYNSIPPEYPTGPVAPVAPVAPVKFKLEYVPDVAPVEPMI